MGALYSFVCLRVHCIEGASYEGGTQWHANVYSSKTHSVSTNPYIESLVYVVEGGHELLLVNQHPK